MPPSIRDNKVDHAMAEYQVPPLPLHTSYYGAEHSLLASSSRTAPSTPKETSQLQKTTSPSLRRVRFSEFQTIVLEDNPVSSIQTDEEKSNLWWSQGELASILADVENIMSAMQYRATMTKRVEIPYHVVLYRIEAACIETKTDSEPKLDPQDLKLLQDWHRNSSSKRGLEKLVLNSHDDNIVKRKSIVQAALVIGERTGIPESLKLEALRKFSENITRRDRILASVLGDADAVCLKPAPKRRSRRATERVNMR